MYDFDTEEDGHLSFHKNEILDIVKQEETGWWAAMRPGGNTIGWIPQAFVRPLNEEMTSRLRNVREELRVYEYEAEQLYNSVETVPLYETQAPAEPEAGPSLSPTWPDRQLAQSTSRDELRRRPYPPSPATPMPQPPAASAPIDKPTPPTPVEGDFIASVSAPPRDRAGSLPATRANIRATRGMGMGMLGNINEQRRGESLSATEFPTSTSPDQSRRRQDKLARLTGSEDAAVFHSAIQLQANLPWYLRPKYSDQLLLDAEGQIRTGTIPAIIEKLASDTFSKDPISECFLRRRPSDLMLSLELAQETGFRNIFLMTFRTFMTADELFTGLVDRYRMDPPLNMTDAEFEEWKERLCLPTQRVILTLFTMWLEDHRLLEEEPHIAQRLTDFLTLITTPQSLSITARLIVQSIARLVCIFTPHSLHL
jgi:son of sevenless